MSLREQEESKWNCPKCRRRMEKYIQDNWFVCRHCHTRFEIIEIGLPDKVEVEK